MSSQGSPLLDLETQHRRWEHAATQLVVCSGLVSPWLLGVPAWLAAVLAGLLCVSLTLGLHHAGWLQGRQQIQRAVWLSDGRWLLTDGSGRQLDGMLRPDSRIGSHFAWLRWDAGRVRSMLLTGRDLVPGDMRRLVVRLRMEGAGQIAAGREAVATSRERSVT